MSVSINRIKEMKQNGEKISMLTAYDYTTVTIADIMRKAVAEYNTDVKAGKFPTNANSYIINKDVIADLEKGYS